MNAKNNTQKKAIVSIPCECIVCTRGGFAGRPGVRPVKGAGRPGVRFAALLQRVVDRTYMCNKEDIVKALDGQIESIKFVHCDCGASEAARREVGLIVARAWRDIQDRRSREHARLMG